MTKLGERRLWKARYRQAKIAWIKKQIYLKFMEAHSAHQMRQQEDPSPFQVDLPKHVPTIQ